MYMYMYMTYINQCLLYIHTLNLSAMFSCFEETQKQISKILSCFYTASINYNIKAQSNKRLLN